MKIQSWKCNIQGSFIHYFSCIVVIFNNILNRDSNLKNAGSEVLNVDNESQFQFCAATFSCCCDNCNCCCCCCYLGDHSSHMDQGPLVAPGPSDEFVTKNGHNDQNIHSTQNNINVAPMPSLWSSTNFMNSQHCIYKLGLVIGKYN